MISKIVYIFKINRNKIVLNLEIKNLIQDFILVQENIQMN